MQAANRASSAFCYQALKKSACMVEASPEESVTCPLLVGRGNSIVALSDGSEIG